MGRHRSTPSDLPKRVYERKGRFYYGRQMLALGENKRDALQLARRYDEERGLTKRRARVIRTERIRGVSALTTAQRREAVLSQITRPGFIDGMFARMRASAKRRGLPINLTRDDVLRLLVESDGTCAVSGIWFSLEEADSKTRKMPWAPSIDRIDSTKGYNGENCRVVCVAVNIALNDFGDRVLQRIAVGVVRKKK